ncbi:O-antigen polysaccharide polymerase Wzy [Clostridium perfringens]|uniref:O-antigen polysaccharide polymerase Wzy n=1 Tax=Clostridium perfringens TaxID=1502 RepID=UPI0018E4443A|nr:O-antigen polysaccharide polymerase Wzy [Clostridium perfringens]MBI6051169.1 O-antigen polysaccharide polymerase Wzy [Clostridium perfringens]HAT4217983.1 O-antigen polysaccharide polymerase Wzy [Clostridium perfringens]
MFLIEKNKLIKSFFMGIVLAIYVFVMLSMIGGSNQKLVLEISTISAFIILIIEIIQIKKITGKVFCPVILFLISYYVFQNGQLLLIALHIDFNSFYINTLKQYMSDVSIFSAISTVLAGYAAFIMCKNKKGNKKIYKIDQMNPALVQKTAQLGFLVCSLVAIPLVIYKASIGIAGGYSAVRFVEGNIPSIINFIEYMFMPFATILMIYSDKKNTKKIAIIVLLWAIITSLCGDRTTGIGAIVLLLYLFSLKEENGLIQKNKLISFLLMLFIGWVIIVFIQVAYAVRTQSAFTYNSIFDVVIQTVADLGFSCFPLFTMMNIVPSYEGFLYGSGYVLSFIGGLIPSFIDFTGIIRKINSMSRVFENWQSIYYSQYSFGFGFSLNAEAYINFGWYGLIILFMLLIFIFKMLSDNTMNENGSYWGKYKSCILLFLWFTLPRRDSYYIWKAIFYSIIVMYVYLRAFSKVVKRK